MLCVACSAYTELKMFSCISMNVIHYTIIRRHAMAIRYKTHTHNTFIHTKCQMLDTFQKIQSSHARTHTRKAWNVMMRRRAAYYSRSWHTMNAVRQNKTNLFRIENRFVTSFHHRWRRRKCFMTNTSIQCNEQQQKRFRIKSMTKMKAMHAINLLVATGWILQFRCMHLFSVA